MARPPVAPLFPYTTLFRSPPLAAGRRAREGHGLPGAGRGRGAPGGGVRRGGAVLHHPAGRERRQDRKSTRLNSSHLVISYAVFCLKKKNNHADIEGTKRHE